MEIKENRIFRKICLSSEEIIKLFEIPFKIIESTSTSFLKSYSLTTGVWGNRLQIWDRKIHSFEHWRVSFSMNEIKSKLRLLSNEKLIDTEYAFGSSYYFIIETTDKNISEIRDRLENIKDSRILFKRYFSNINPREITLSELIEMGGKRIKNV